MRVRKAGKVRVAEEAAREVRVDVQRLEAAAVERLLHLPLGIAVDAGVVPGRVCGPGDAGKREREAGLGAAVEAGEGEVHDRHLLVDHALRYVALRPVADHVDPDGNARLEAGASLALGAVRQRLVGRGKAPLLPPRLR